VRFAFRHFPLTEIHPHAFAASAGMSRVVSRRAMYEVRPPSSSTAVSTETATPTTPCCRHWHDDRAARRSTAQAVAGFDAQKRRT
jgi:hypothetical protein